jgi:hypothetical protein
MLLDISSNSFHTKVIETHLTPKRIVGYDVSWDNIGPKLCAMGTITGENSGIAELASCKRIDTISKLLVVVQKQIFIEQAAQKEEKKYLNMTFSVLKQDGANAI